MAGAFITGSVGVAIPNAKGHYEIITGHTSPLHYRPGSEAFSALSDAEAGRSHSMTNTSRRPGVLQAISQNLGAEAPIGTLIPPPSRPEPITVVDTPKYGTMSTPTDAKGKLVDVPLTDSHSPLPQTATSWWDIICCGCCQRRRAKPTSLATSKLGNSSESFTA